MPDINTGGEETKHIEKQLEVINQQKEEIHNNPELSDTQKEREVKKLELVETQLIEGQQKEIDHRQQGVVYERNSDFFND